MKKTIIAISLAILCVMTYASYNNMGDKFVKTKFKCNHSGCCCSGYWGYQSPVGNYHGNCCNSDGWGHRCNHSPKEHGL